MFEAFKDERLKELSDFRKKIFRDKYRELSYTVTFARLNNIITHDLGILGEDLIEEVIRTMAFAHAKKHASEFGCFDANYKNEEGFPYKKWISKSGIGVIYKPDISQEELEKEIEHRLFIEDACIRGFFNEWLENHGIKVPEGDLREELYVLYSDLTWRYGGEETDRVFSVMSIWEKEEFKHFI